MINKEISPPMSDFFLFYFSSRSIGEPWKQSLEVTEFLIAEINFILEEELLYIEHGECSKLFYR